jgi:hypothetical protein
MPSTAKDGKIEAEEEPSSPKNDNTTDYLGYLTYLAGKAKEEGPKDHLPVMAKGVDGEEALRLAMKASELQGTLGGQRLHLTGHMPKGMDEEEALRLATEASHPPAPPAPKSPWDQWHAPYGGSTTDIPYGCSSAGVPSSGVGAQLTSVIVDLTMRTTRRSNRLGFWPVFF